MYVRFVAGVRVGFAMKIETIEYITELLKKRESVGIEQYIDSEGSLRYSMGLALILERGILHKFKVSHYDLVRCSITTMDASALLQRLKLTSTNLLSTHIECTCTEASLSTITDIIMSATHKLLPIHHAKP